MLILWFDGGHRLQGLVSELCDDDGWMSLLVSLHIVRTFVGSDAYEWITSSTGRFSGGVEQVLF
jgi:hypothetical protein